MLKGISLTETTHFVLYQGLDIWHSFPDITHIEVNNGLKLVILNLIELTFLRAYPHLKPHILF